jgi:hypothetical protein
MLVTADAVMVPNVVKKITPSQPPSAAMSTESDVTSVTPAAVAF